MVKKRQGNQKNLKIWLIYGILQVSTNKIWRQGQKS